MMQAELNEGHTALADPFIEWPEVEAAEAGIAVGRETTSEGGCNAPYTHLPNRFLHAMMQ